MLSPARHEKRIERVTEIYVAVFPISVNEHQMAEVILAGFQNDPNVPNRSMVRATVETHRGALPDLVGLCDEIVGEQEEMDSYRLLKFDKNGMHILNPADFRTFAQQYAHARWGLC